MIDFTAIAQGATIATTDELPPATGRQQRPTSVLVADGVRKGHRSPAHRTAGPASAICTTKG